MNRRSINRWLALSMAASASPLAWAQAAPTQRATRQAQATGTAHTGIRVLVVGDSISAEYGLARGNGWVALLAQRIQDQALPAQIINASISGDTTAGGRSRLPALLAQHQPQVVLLELGGNDALRGLPLTSTQANLLAMTEAAQQAGAQVVLAGMQVPPNYGSGYAEGFTKLFADVAQQRGTALVPFLLKGIADGPQPTALFQADRIHPNAQAQPLIVDNVWPVLLPLLRPPGQAQAN